MLYGSTSSSSGSSGAVIPRSSSVAFLTLKTMYSSAGEGSKGAVTVAEAVAVGKASTFRLTVLPTSSFLPRRRASSSTT